MICIGSNKEHYLVLKDALEYHGFNCSVQGTNNNSKILWVLQTYKNPPKNYIYWIHNTLKFKPSYNIYKSADKRAKIFKNALAIASYDKSDLEIIKRDYPDKKTLYIPFGYTKYHEKIFQPKYKGPKTIDILFYGRRNNPGRVNRRGIFINYLRSQGLNVVWLGENDKSPTVHGSKRDEYIAKSKIVLFIAQNDPKECGNALSRLMFLFANHVLTIFEKTGDNTDTICDDLSKYTPMFETKEELAKLCKIYLAKSDKEIQEMTEKVYNYVVENLSLYKMLPYKDIKNIYDNI